MSIYRCVKSFKDTGEISDRSADLMRMFALTADRVSHYRRVVDCEIDIEQGDIVFITGPSGAGKSVLLKQLKGQIDKSQYVDVNDINLPDKKRLVDCIGNGLVSAVKYLNTAGLNDCLCMLNTPSNLSAGQKWRFRLAAAVSENKKWIFADEFCGNLDRITAAVIAAGVRKHADRTGKTFVLASSIDDILPNLQPDVIVEKELNAKANVIYKTRNRQRKAEL